MRATSLAILGIGIAASYAQTRRTENLLIIGWDGVRWQEIFTGVDSAIMNERAFTKRSAAMRKEFWDNDARAIWNFKQSHCWC